MKTRTPRFYRYFIAFCTLLFLSILVPCSGIGQACSYGLSYGAGISVDGDLSDWDLISDFYAGMYEAGCAPGFCNNDKDLLSNLYLRYDCNTETMYALIVMESGEPADISPADAWIKIDANNNKVVDGNSGNDGTPPDFEWSGDTNVFEGFEASFPLTGAIDPVIASYTLEAHINSDGRTSSTGKFAQSNQICLDISCQSCTNPDQPMASGATYCEGDMISGITATGEAMASFAWYSDPGLQNQIMIGVSGANNETYTPAGAGTFYVTQIVGGCESPAIQVEIIVEQVPFAGVSNDVSICDHYSSEMDLNELLDGEDVGGAWSRQSGSNGIFDSVNGTFTPSPDATTSVFRYTVSGAPPCSNDFTEVTIIIDNCSFISFGNTFSPGDPCQCDDNLSSNGSGDGTFSEVLTVIGLPGFDLYIGPGSTPAQLVGTPFNEGPAGTYQVGIQHTDAQGFSVFVADLNDDLILDMSNAPLFLSNVCAYTAINEPNITSICALDPPIDIISMITTQGGMVSAEIEDPGGFILPVTTFDPTNAVEGEYIVTWYFDGDFISNTGGTLNDPAIPGCETSYTARFQIVPCVQEVPTLGEWGIVILSLLLLIGTTLGVRRQLLLTS